MSVVTLKRRSTNANDYQLVSAEAQVSAHGFARDSTGSAADWMQFIDSELVRIFAECQTPDWDGEGGSPVSDNTIFLTRDVALTLFDLLPKWTPVPDVIPESDGEICLTWSVDAGHIFSLSIGEHGKMNFAGQFGDGGVHAWQAVDNAVLANALEDVVRYIERLYPAVSANASERRAA